MNIYESVNMLVTAEEAATLNSMLNEVGIEGCTNRIFMRPCWPEGTVLTYLPDGTVDLVQNPPTEYLASGWLHVDAVDLLPENAFIAEVPA